jgi:adenine-specific DNA-methyltransferase
MDNRIARELIENTFIQPFAEDRFEKFVLKLLNEIDVTKSFGYLTENKIKDSYKSHVEKYRCIGTYTDPGGDKADVLVVKLKNEKALDRSRTMLRNFTADYLKKREEKDAAIVAYYTDNLEDWRFSYIRMEYKREKTETGKVRIVQDVTPARRYSFLVGKNEPNHTAQSQLIDILKDDINNPLLAKIEAAFSVESVTKQFYLDYCNHFEKLCEELTRIVNEDSKIAKEFKAQSIEVDNFAKKLMGQIVFLYFLQKKGWLGVEKDVNGNFKKWGEGQKKFLRKLFQKKFGEYENFFNDMLEPLFYEALATKRSKDYFSQFNCKIPFLNGGLFEPLNDYNWEETDITISDEIIGNILDTFDLYNFTVREDEPLEKEVAVDPEMLGKVFENLLPENIRKGKGAFYTPRPIVHYMCQESLINYLDSECDGIPKEDIGTLIREGDIILELETAIKDGTKSYKSVLMDSIKENAQALDKALETIKICDPAIGSGAFPVGMLIEIVKTREVLNLYLEEEKSIYDLKKCCIQNSLYGVDIDTGAIEIAKLRLWLSLVVDEVDYSNIQPLPNLDYKIIQGNSLIEEFHGISLDIEGSQNSEGGMYNDNSEVHLLIDNLHSKQQKFMNTSSYEGKKKLKAEVEKLMVEIFRTQLKKLNRPYFDARKRVLEKSKMLAADQRGPYLNDEYKGIDKKFGFNIVQEEEDLHEMTHGNKTRNFFPWKLYFAEVFKNNGGFDIVIANPPYLKERDNAKVFKPVNESLYGLKYHQGKMDYWYYFLHRAIDSKNNKGGISFITSRYWIQSSGATKLINRIKENIYFSSVLDIGKVKVFDNVVGQHIVSVYDSIGENKTIYKNVDNTIDDIFSTIDTENISISNIDPLRIIQNNEIRFTFSKVDLEKHNIITLGDVLDCSQGVVEAPDKISRKAFNLQPIEGVSIGEGIFVLNKTEKFANGFNNENCIKPYLDPNAIGRYCINHSDEFLIYSDKNVKEEIKNGKYEKIKAHLDKYRPYITSSNKPYGIHRARKQKYFDNPKLICKGMFSSPDFTYDDEKYYVGFSFTVMIQKDPDFLLKYVLAILNSKVSHYWFIYNGKRRGIGFDIGVKKFRQFPIIKTNLSNQEKLEFIVDQILTTKKANQQADTIKLEAEIDQLVYELYGLTEEEIKIVEESAL